MVCTFQAPVDSEKTILARVWFCSPQDAGLGKSHEYESIVRSETQDIDVCLRRR